MFILLGAIVVVAAIIMLLRVINPKAFDASFLGSLGQPHKPNVRYQRYDEAFERIREKEEVDRILDKIARQGIDKLSRSERETLEVYSRKN